MQRIADTRTIIATVAEATQHFAQIVKAECALAKEKALKACRVAKINEAYEAKVAPIIAERDGLIAPLRGFILSNPKLFVKPRKIQTDGGSFGMQEVCELHIDSEEALKKLLVDRDMVDCFRTEIIIDKPALKKRLNAGASIPYCRLKEGETAVYKVSPALLKEQAEAVSEVAS